MEQEENEINSKIMSRKWKLITSSVIWYCTFTLGLGAGFIGPSLVELSRKFNSDIPTLSKVFTIITASFLVGVILCGTLFNYLNRQFTSALLLMLMGIGSMLMPLVSSVPMFFSAGALLGFGASGYDTAQIVWIIEIWESNAAAYIQMQHFCFALGTFVSPLLMKSFLPENDINNYELQSNISQSIGNNSTFNTTISMDTEETDSKFYVPFIIGGLAAVFGGCLIIILYFVKKYEKPKPSPAEHEDSLDISGGKSKNCNSEKVLLIMLSAAVLGGYSATELCSMQFLPLFTRFIDLKLSQPDGALVVSGLTGAFTVGRALGIFVVLKVRPEFLLLGNIILILIGNSLLLFFANYSIIALWIGAILLGAGFSTVFPSFYGYIEKHLRVSNVVGAILLVAGGLVSGVYPIIIGQFISKNPVVLMYTNYFSLILCTGAFIIIYYITNKKSNTVFKVTDKYPNNEKDEITLQNS